MKSDHQPTASCGQGPTSSFIAFQLDEELDATQTDGAMRMVLNVHRENEGAEALVEATERLIELLPTTGPHENQRSLLLTARKLIKLVDRINCNRPNLQPILMLLPSILPMVKDNTNLLTKIEVFDSVLELVRAVVHKLCLLDQYCNMISQCLQSFMVRIVHFLNLQDKARVKFEKPDLERPLVECDVRLKLTQCEILLRQPTHSANDDLNMDQHAKDLQVLTFVHQEHLLKRKVTGFALLAMAEVEAMHKGEEGESRSIIESWYSAALTCFREAVDWADRTDQDVAIDLVEFALARFYAGRQFTEEVANFLSEIESQPQVGFGDIAKEIKIMLTLLAYRPPARSVLNQLLDMTRSFHRGLTRIPFIAAEWKTEAEYQRLYLAAQAAPSISIKLAEVYSCFEESVLFMNTCVELNKAIGDPNCCIAALQRCWRMQCTHALDIENVALPDDPEHAVVVAEGREFIIDYVRRSFHPTVLAIEQMVEADEEQIWRNVAACTEHYCHFLDRIHDHKTADEILVQMISRIVQGFGQERSARRSFLGRLYKKSGEVSTHLNSLNASIRGREQLDRAVSIFLKADDWFSEREKRKEIRDCNEIRRYTGPIPTISRAVKAKLAP